MCNVHAIQRMAWACLFRFSGYQYLVLKQCEYHASFSCGKRADRGVTRKNMEKSTGSMTKKQYIYARF